LELHDHNGHDDLCESQATIFVHSATASATRNIHNLRCRWKLMRSLSTYPWPSGTSSSLLPGPLRASVHDMEYNLAAI
jgi:hypothetical protein